MSYPTQIYVEVYFHCIEHDKALEIIEDFQAEYGFSDLTEKGTIQIPLCKIESYDLSCLMNEVKDTGIEFHLILK